MKNYQLFGNIGNLTILHYYPKLNENTFESIQVRLIQYILGIKMANCKKLKSQNRPSLSLGICFLQCHHWPC